MGTNIKPEITENKKYYISKHRYYELLHFCRQYNEFNERYRNLSDVTVKALEYTNTHNGELPSNYTQETAIKLEALDNKIHMIEDSATESDPLLKDYIIMAVTKGTSYTNLFTVHNIPCSKNTFYDRYRKFFWLLDKKRG